MAERFYTILTNTGKAAIANASATGEKVDFQYMALGDSFGGYYNPTEEQTELKNEVYRAQINHVAIDEKNPNWIKLAIVIPSNVGGFSVREVGVFDTTGNMLAIGKYPQTYKPIVESGSSKDLTINMILEVVNTEVVNLKINPTIILATKEDVNTVNEKAVQTQQDLEGHKIEYIQLKDKVDSLKTNDIEARHEILDIKLKLNEMKLQDDEGKVLAFLKQTGIGFADIFDNTENIDTVNTTAAIDTTATNVTFANKQLLKFEPLQFPSIFNNVELAIYDKERELFQIDTDVDNSTEINMLISPGSRKIGESFYYKGETYTIRGVQEL